MGQSFRNGDSPHDGFENIDWMDGQPWNRGVGQRTLKDRRGRGGHCRHTELTARPTIGWCGAITRAAAQLHHTGARLSQVLIRVADS
jgi:hypothetical protein